MSVMLTVLSGNPKFGNAPSRVDPRLTWIYCLVVSMCEERGLTGTISSNMHHKKDLRIGDHKQCPAHEVQHTNLIRRICTR